MYNVRVRKKEAIFLVYNIYNRRLVGITLMYTFETQFIEVTYLVECDIALPGTNESRGQWARDTADQSESGTRGEMEAEWCILLKSNVGKDQPSQGILGAERVGAIYINSYQFQALDVISISVAIWKNIFEANCYFPPSMTMFLSKDRFLCKGFSVAT